VCLLAIIAVLVSVLILLIHYPFLGLEIYRWWSRLFEERNITSEAD
jgi:hypothetical protein